MDEEKEKEMNVDVVDAPEEPVENEQRVEERSTENKTTADTNKEKEELVPLFEGDQAEKFRSRWLAIQSKFVDDPSDSVKQADDLVADVIKNVTMSFANRRLSLEKQWNSGESSTEDLRVALKQYRSFFDRLLTLES